MTSTNDTSRSPARRVARAVTAPARNYLNQHFEQVKDEIRRQGDTTPDTPGVSADRAAAIEAQFAEQALHQTQAISRLTDEVAALGERIGELEAQLLRLIEIVTPAEAADD